MNEQYPSQRLEKAIEQLALLPGIGRKTALRLALYLLRQPESLAINLGEALKELRLHICYCQKCHNISDTSLCSICQDPSRDATTILVVETIREVIAFEATASYKGLYHVLGGVVSPIDGVSPSDLAIEPLLERLKSEPVKEVILALSATPEGETTSFYLHRKLSGFPTIVLSRLSRGIAVGDELEYTDELTLAQALKDRATLEPM